MRPNEISESALRAAVNAVSAATVTPGASPRAFSAALSRSSASFSLRGLLSVMRQNPIRPFDLGPIPMSVLATQEDRELESAERRSSSSTAPKSAVPLGPQQRLFNSAFNPSGEPDGSRPASRDRPQYRSVRVRMPVFSG